MLYLRRRDMVVGFFKELKVIKELKDFKDIKVFKDFKDLNFILTHRNVADLRHPVHPSVHYHGRRMGSEDNLNIGIQFDNKVD